MTDPIYKFSKEWEEARALEFVHDSQELLHGLSQWIVAHWSETPEELRSLLFDGMKRIKEKFYPSDDAMSPRLQDSA